MIDQIETGPGEIPSRRAQLLQINIHDLMKMVSGKIHAIIPEGAAAVDAMYEWASDSLLVKLRHESFPEVPVGVMPPRIDAEYVTSQQISIALAKLYSGCAPGDEMWCELDYAALEYAIGHPVERKPVALFPVTGE